MQLAEPWMPGCYCETSELSTVLCTWTRSLRVTAECTTLFCVFLHFSWMQCAQLNPLKIQNTLLCILCLPDHFHIKLRYKDTLLCIWTAGTFLSTVAPVVIRSVMTHLNISPALVILERLSVWPNSVLLSVPIELCQYYQEPIQVKQRWAEYSATDNTLFKSMSVVQVKCVWTLSGGNI